MLKKLFSSKIQQYIHLLVTGGSSDEKDTDINKVLKRADGALYQAKNEGRNRAVVH